ncbi:unnamed protein product [Strongylus vulgaris]|uniref:Uncharacterized protein n=1 Tax=Strongylus vulgaris TaxID=40348 RepID=A0A3P7L9H2_STRVU|nr:unnamed protein product [Strongylus vulgaris]
MLPEFLAYFPLHVEERASYEILHIMQQLVDRMDFERAMESLKGCFWVAILTKMLGPPPSVPDESSTSQQNTLTRTTGTLSTLKRERAKERERLHKELNILGDAERREETPSKEKEESDYKPTSPTSTTHPPLKEKTSYVEVLPLLFVSSSLIGPILHRNKMTVSLPFSMLGADGSDVISNGYSIQRTQRGFNSSNPAFSALDFMDTSTFGVLLKTT